MDRFGEALDGMTGGAITQAQRQEQRQAEQAPSTEQTANGNARGSVAEGFDPVLNMTRSDLQFWMMVVQLIILYGIYRKLE